MATLGSQGLADLSLSKTSSGVLDTVLKVHTLEHPLYRWESGEKSSKIKDFFFPQRAKLETFQTRMEENFDFAWVSELPSAGSPVIWNWSLNAGHFSDSLVLSLERLDFLHFPYSSALGLLLILQPASHQRPGTPRSRAMTRSIAEFLCSLCSAAKI